LIGFADFILFHGKRHPKEMGEAEMNQFLSHLAAEKNVSASTQNQAFSALLFPYQQVLERKLNFIDNVQRVTRPAKFSSTGAAGSASPHLACRCRSRCATHSSMAARAASFAI
jgi:site-specific recombinase XerD